MAALDWNAPTVANLETGRRRLSADPLVLLRLICARLAESTSYSLTELVAQGSGEYDGVRIGRHKYAVVDVVDLIHGDLDAMFKRASDETRSEVKKQAPVHCRRSAATSPEHSEGNRAIGCRRGQARRIAMPSRRSISLGDLRAPLAE